MATALVVANSPPADPALQAAAFAAEFRAAYGDRGPQWLQQGWAAATSSAHAELKFLLVYLHAPDHEVGRAPGGAG
jgi:hypothetical protein